MAAEAIRSATHPTASEPPAPAPRRLRSLDWTRGIFLVASVATDAVLPPRPAQLVHATWTGLTFYDFIFPLFVTLSGCGLAFAYHKAVSWRVTARRCLVLLLVGLVYNAVTHQTWSLGSLRFTGPLQVYAVLVLVIGVAHLWARSPRAWALITLGAGSAQAFLLAAWQAGCPDAALTPSCNPSGFVDLALLGSSHMYAQGALGHDPEGLFSILGAFVTASAGATAGHLMLRSRGSRRGPVRLLAWAATCFAAGLCAGLFLPTMKRLWTTPFALGVGALGVVILLIGSVLMDRPARPRWEHLRARVSWPLVGMGRNSLLVYFGSHVATMLMLGAGTPPGTAVMQLARRIAVFGHPRLTFVIVNVLAWALLAAALHRRRIYVHA